MTVVEIKKWCGVQVVGKDIKSNSDRDGILYNNDNNSINSNISDEISNRA